MSINADLYQQLRIFMSCASCFDENYLYYDETLSLSLAKTKMMENKNDNPRIYTPPPLLYVATFFVAVLIQKLLPLNRDFFYTTTSKLIGSFIILIAYDHIR